MKNCPLFKMWVAAALAAAPGVLHAQTAALPDGPSTGKAAAELKDRPKPPRPPRRPGKEDVPTPAMELQKLSALSGSFVKPVANDRAEYSAFFLKTSNGEVLVKFPPHLGEQLIKGKQTGEPLKVTGFYRTTPENKQEFQLVNAEVNGRLITDNPPQAPRELSTPQQRVLNATIQSLRYNPNKDINGFVLSSGEVINFPPHVGQQLAAQLKTGEKVTVSGFAEPKRPGVVYSENLNFFKAQTIALGGQAYLVR
ncbi:hypothetical protein INP83_11630 [Mucilaginibacter sp. 21P]|uniref:hypothetical protein n=1 Tax=Mucilaginibacter sp. 21P TaxID=2778902 RepID=UPI001C5617FC|nr:hypothetical protein [Mucilaginibacter sp. 21P]QXV63758.1 hypothetical protein INP83_11630 [Mucilaginibacter sp. 21P]